MFINDATKIDTGIFTDNLEAIKKDYIRFRDMDYFFDYSHTYNLTADAGDFSDFVPTQTGYKWQVCPMVLIVGRLKLYH